MVGLGTYVFAPAFLVLRDFVLWKIIKRFVLNDRLHTLIEMRAGDVWYLKHKYNYSRSIRGSTSGTKYLLNEAEVSEEKFKEVSEAISVHERRADSAGAEIAWRSNLVNWLLRHYKQEGTSNPIPQWERDAYERVERREQKSG